ncbi:MAG: hypothetical protein JSV44_10355 [Candidatus Zixiibacteriota bacterium]|nr:MAG: hypothetical protein JSV44_10355 [candidate division Zixibacteria bacterium]
MRTALIWGVVLLGSLAHAARHQVTSLPYTASTNYDTLTLAGTKLSGGGNGIRITARNVFIDLGTDTLEFGTSNGNGFYGIHCAAGSHDITVSGGVILHGGAGNYNQCLRLARTNDVLISNTSMVVNGTNGHCIESASVGAPGNYNIEISGGEYWNNCHGYTSRCQYDGCAIRLSLSSYGGYGNYHYNIHGITMHNTPGQGILISGRNQTSNAALAYVYDNTLTGDARNSFYDDCPVASCGTCRSSANPYMIAMLKCAPGSQCFNNVITSGSHYGGSRGILIENCTGSPNNPIKVYGNYVDIHEGPNVEYGTGLAVHGLRMRAIDGGSLTNIWVYGNSFICTGDNLASTSAYNSSVMPLRYSNRAPFQNVTIENNLFRAKSNTPGVSSTAVVFDYVQADETFVFRRNRIEGDGILIQYGNNASGASGIVLHEDTLAFLSPAYDPQTFHVGYLSNSWVCTDNYACDIVYDGNARDTNIVMANRGTLEMGLQRTLRVNVLGYNGLPVKNALVTVSNNYGRVVVNKYTGARGTVRGIVTYWWEQRVGTDSTNFNPFTVRVQKGADITQTALNISHNSSLSPLILANTAGEECTDCDYICGDFDGDSAINLIDLLLLIMYLYAGGDAPVDARAVDVNGDGDINLSDVLKFAQFHYSSGPPLDCPE